MTFSGQPRVTIKDYQGGNLTLTLKGAPELTMSIKGDHLVTSMTGSGSVTYTGEVDYQDVEIEGSAIYDATALKSREVNVHLVGEGKASVQADKDIDIIVVGSGSVTYESHGAKVSKKIHGSGTIQP